MIKNSYPGKFIVFEGLDGSGQTTQAELLRDFLYGQGKEVLLTKEPTKESAAGKKIREILNKKEPISPKKFQELFAEDRREHLQNLIIPSLQQGTWVISDRYFFTSFAYGVAEGVELKYLIEINDAFLLPDLSFFLKVKPEICIERIKLRGQPLTYFEKKEHFEKARKVFESLAERFKNVYVIDAEQPIGKVAKDIQTIFAEKL